MTEFETEQRTVIVGVKLPDTVDFEISLEELASLVDTAGGICFAAVTQERQCPDARTYIGAGKLEELRCLCAANGVALVVFDCELTPSQINNLEKSLDGPSVIDRSMLILDIFAKHAVTREGQIQVELAQLDYTAPRLKGKGTELSGQGGGIGTRGPGETKLETDRRHLERRRVYLERQLEDISRNRANMRKARDRSGIPKGAIVGYTNAGKSALMNALCGTGILSEDKLFATLDTTTKKYGLPDGTEILLSDTVGFIRNLPHKLIAAFNATLDEVRYSDFIIHVIDCSENDIYGKITVTEELLDELGAGGKPLLYVFNKTDIAADLDDLRSYVKESGIAAAFVSAKTLDGLGGLDMMLEKVAKIGKRRVKMLFPYGKENDLNRLMRQTGMRSVEHTDEGTLVVFDADEKLAGQFGEYVV